MLLGYPPEFTEPIRKEVQQMGLQELLTKDDVEATIHKGSVLVLINSVCGCAAANARPGIAKALKHSKLPEKVTTVFAGVHKEATAAVRLYIDKEPSSPSVALFKDGKVVFFLPRTGIEGHSADDIAKEVVAAFDAL